MAVIVFRFFESLGTNAGKHLVSLVTDGADARLVFENRIEHPDVPAGLMKRVLSRADGHPSTAEEWARQISNFYPLSTTRREERVGTLNEVSLQEHVEFRDFVDEEVTPSLQPSRAEEPEDMRQTIRMLLEQQGALHLNPGLHNWLNGGEPPKDFDGLLLYPEQVEDRANNSWQYRMFFSVPSRELVAVLRIDPAGQRVTEERIDGAWEQLPPGDPDEFSGLLVKVIEPRFLAKFLSFFDDAERRGVSVLASEVEVFSRPMD